MIQGLAVEIIRYPHQTPAPKIPAITLVAEHGSAFFDCCEFKDAGRPGSVKQVVTHKKSAKA
jgi:hypothetical protein